MLIQLLFFLFTVTASLDVYYLDHDGSPLVSVLEVPNTNLSKYPAALVFHDATGIDDHELNKARELKEKGWIVLVADMFATRNLTEIAEMKPYPMVTTKARRWRAQAAYDFISSHPKVDTRYIVAFGYCFGGFVTLELGRLGADLKLLSTFHASDLSASDNSEYGNITGTVLINNGADDPLVSIDAIVEIQSQLTKYNVDWEFVNYGNTQHSFTVEADYRYNAKSADRSWRKTWELMQKLTMDSMVPPSMPITSNTVEYTDADGTLFKGFLAQPEKMISSKPAVLILPGQTGLEAHEKDTAEKLAQLGFTALAVDMYGNGQTTDDFSEAGRMSQPLKDNITLTNQRIQAALDVLTGCEVLGVESSQIVIFGYCLGGALGLAAARSNLSVAAVVSFHGILPVSFIDGQTAMTSAYEGTIAVENGAADVVTNQTNIESFLEEMKNTNVDWYFANYANAAHGFTYKGSTFFNEKAYERSWNDGLSILHGFEQKPNSPLRNPGCPDTESSSISMSSSTSPVASPTEASVASMRATVVASFFILLLACIYA